MASKYLLSLTAALLMPFYSACGTDTKVINDDIGCLISARNKAQVQASHHDLSEEGIHFRWDRFCLDYKENAIKNLELCLREERGHAYNCTVLGRDENELTNEEFVNMCKGNLEAERTRVDNGGLYGCAEYEVVE